MIEKQERGVADVHPSREANLRRVSRRRCDRSTPLELALETLAGAALGAIGVGMLLGVAGGVLYLVLGFDSRAPFAGLWVMVAGMVLGAVAGAIAPHVLSRRGVTPRRARRRG